MSYRLVLMILLRVQRVSSCILQESTFCTGICTKGTWSSYYSAQRRDLADDKGSLLTLNA